MADSNQSPCPDGLFDGHVYACIYCNAHLEGVPDDVTHAHIAQPRVGEVTLIKLSALRQDG